jgi:integrase
VTSNGGSVIRYEGARGTTWRVKFRDATGRQVMETLGREADGWTERKALRALGARLAEVDRLRWRQPEKVTFSEFAERFESEVLPGRNLKPSTNETYKTIVHGHLIPFFGVLDLAAIEAADLDRYIATKTAALSAKTVGNHLALLHSMFKVARRWRLVGRNPVEDVDRPRADSPEMSVLTEAEIGRLLVAYRELEMAPPEGTEAADWRQARRVVTVALGTGLRRGELLALRWRDVQLLEGVLSVREWFVRGQFQAPKSRKSRRTFGLGQVTVEALNEQWAESAYRTDDDLVFCHRLRGTPLDPQRVSHLLRAAVTKAGITKPFRVFHDLRHTAITHDAAAGNPQAYIQMKAGHSQGAITERYIHAAAVMFPGAADKSEARLFSAVETEGPG